MTKQELRSSLGLKNDEYRKPDFLPGLIEMTIPDKPRGQSQHYRRTLEGRDSADVHSVHDATMEVTMEVTMEDDMEVTMEVAARLLQAFASETDTMARQGLQSSLGLKNNECVRKPALRAGLIEMTIPDKPRSQNQCYRLTPEGQDVLR